MIEERILDQIYFAHKYLNELERSAHDYGTGEGLFSSEIHTITAVADHPGINLTQLAEELNISKAAVSKFTAKMITRGYIEKSRPRGNQKEVLFNPTERGKIAGRGHKKFAKKTFGPLIQVEQDLSNEEREIITAYMRRLKEIILQ